MMAKDNIKLGLASHFRRTQWQKDAEYHKTMLIDFEKALEQHGRIVKTAYQNIIAFLKSIHGRDATDCENMYESILKEDQDNLNALVGLYECTQSGKRKQNCKERINTILTSPLQNQAIPRALLEIGLALAELIPRYQDEDTVPKNKDRAYYKLDLDSYQSLEFMTVETVAETDLYTDYNTELKKRGYSSLRYFREGMSRLESIEAGTDEEEVLIWNFFLAKTHNRLDYWVAYTTCPSKLRRDLILKALDIFCKIVTKVNPLENRVNRMYYQRSLAYIGQILSSRKNILHEEYSDDSLPSCFQNGEILNTIWNEPKKAFIYALDYGHDDVVHTRYAKVLLHENKYNEAIEHIDQVFRTNNSIHWFSASIRMKAYRFRHKQRYNDAKGEFSCLTKDDLLAAEKDGRYCFDTYATPKDLSEYAVILHWLGTFSNGGQVTDEMKIRAALNVLERVYKEQGCHTHFRVHKIRAECHADLGELDDAIKYSIWSLNSCPYDYAELSPAFIFLISVLLRTLKHEDKQRSGEHLKRIQYFTGIEIKRCHDLIRKEIGQIDDSLSNKVSVLLNQYDKRYIDEAEELAISESDKRFVQKLKKRYMAIFRNIRKWCDNYPDQMKALLNFALDSNFDSKPTLVTMCLKCLGKDHKEWTREFNKKMKTRPDGRKKIELFSPSPECVQPVRNYDFVVINAPEDKEWVFYTFLPEMEDRPILSRGCVPDRDFQEQESFEENIMRCLKRTSKVFLIVSTGFFERVYEILKTKILFYLTTKHNERMVDVIALFQEGIQLDKTKYRQLMQFENVDASDPHFSWNYPRKLLFRPLTPPGKERQPVYWEDTDDGEHVRPGGDEAERKRILEEVILPYGVPSAMYIIHRGSYILGFDGVRKVAIWVAHKIDRSRPRGLVSRKTHHKQLRSYHSDLAIPEQARSTQKDYNTDFSGTIMGHLTPLADHSSDVASARETNYMTNIIPECKNNFLWNRLEEYCRDELIKKFDTIYVIAGPLFRPKENAMETNDSGQGRPFESAKNSSDDPIDKCTNGMKNFQLDNTHARKSTSQSKTVSYKVIGDNEVAVPTHLYKIIIAKNSSEDDKELCIGAFMVPNEPLVDAELDELSVPISKLESWLGTPLCQHLEKAIRKKKKSTLQTPFYPKEYRMKKMIQYIDNLTNLEFIWDSLSEELKGSLRTAYEEKLNRLKSKSSGHTNT